MGGLSFLTRNSQTTDFIAILATFMGAGGGGGGGSPTGGDIFTFQEHLILSRNVLFNDALNTCSVIWRQTWWRATQVAKKETHCCYFIGYSFRLAARDFFISAIPYHGLCYTKFRKLAGTRNRSVGPP